MDTNIIIAGVPIVGLVIALCELVKLYISGKWIPLVSLILGIACVAFVQHSIDISTIVLGIMAGLTASGLFSGGKAVITK